MSCFETVYHFCHGLLYQKTTFSHSLSSVSVYHLVWCTVYPRRLLQLWQWLVWRHQLTLWQADKPLSLSSVCFCSTFAHCFCILTRLSHLVDFFAIFHISAYSIIVSALFKRLSFVTRLFSTSSSVSCDIHGFMGLCYTASTSLAACFIAAPSAFTNWSLFRML